VYGIEERQGFVALIGEVGLGKTTILRSYLERVDQSQLKPIYIFNANVSFSELLKTLCREFGIAEATEDVAETVHRLHQVLIEEYRQGRNVALIVDEAQHMPIETLEHLRMLSNLETSTQKLIQIVLVGQPEFDVKLEDYALRQLKQRLAIRGTISPLTDEESRDYINYRLAKVITVDEPIFTRNALREIIKQAQGTPRVINILCTNALIHGFGYNKRRISTKIVREAVAEYTGKPQHRLWKPWMTLAGATALVAALFWFSPYQQVVWSKLSSLTQSMPFVTPSATSRVSPAPSRPAVARDNLLPVPPSVPALPTQSPRVETSSPPPEMSEPAAAVPATVRTIKRGDQIVKIALEVYGSSSSAVLDWIKKNNPQLRNVNRLDVGMQLTLPPLPADIR
jgi:general secretion pathway protein A